MGGMINGAGGRKKCLLRAGGTAAVFAVFGREEGGEILPKPGLRDGIVEDAHVVGPVAVAAAVGVAVEIGIAGEIVAALAGVDVGFVKLVIAGGTIIEEDHFGGSIAGAGNDLGGLHAGDAADGPFGD